jgi:YD repeat-containing protein
VVLHSYSNEANSNRLQSQGGAQTLNYTYDPVGHLTGDGRFNHTYNADGRRIASTNTATGQITGYGYNALGQRISKTSVGSVAQYVYDEQGHLDLRGRSVRQQPAGAEPFGVGQLRVQPALSGTVLRPGNRVVL